jgi:hypothetical protein
MKRNKRENNGEWEKYGWTGLGQKKTLSGLLSTVG